MKKLIASLVVLLGLAGCTPVEEKATASIKNAYVVTVGVEKGFAGKCAGSKSDSARMKSLLSKYAKTMVCLQNEKATKANVLAALEAAAKTPLAIFYFSGHGGQTPAKTDTTEVDKKDEFICCYDAALLDNDIWNAVSKSTGRVVLIFDCCHSGTMFRQAKFTFASQRAKALKATTVLPGTVSLLCWSGCPDSDYSWGSSAGGYMTNVLRSKYSKRLTYDQVWAKIESQKTLKRYEAVQQTKIGKDFGSTLVFQ